MHDIKHRLGFIKKTLESNIYEKLKRYEAEIICLQFRSVIELILLANLSAHKKWYSKGFEKLKKEWRISSIIKFIENINPSFFPIPLQEKNRKGSEMNPQALPVENIKGALTKDDIIDIYETCSNMLHARNPFASEKDFEIRDTYLKWWNKIVELLDIHTIQLVDVAKRIIVAINFNLDSSSNDVIIIHLTIAK